MARKRARDGSSEEEVRAAACVRVCVRAPWLRVIVAQAAAAAGAPVSRKAARPAAAAAALNTFTARHAPCSVRNVRTRSIECVYAARRCCCTQTASTRPEEGKVGAIESTREALPEESARSDAFAVADIENVYAPLLPPPPAGSSII